MHNLYVKAVFVFSLCFESAHVTLEYDNLLVVGLNMIFQSRFFLRLEITLVTRVDNAYMFNSRVKDEFMFMFCSVLAQVALVWAQAQVALVCEYDYSEPIFASIGSHRSHKCR
jgi:hypothetical protein